MRVIGECNYVDVRRFYLPGIKIVDDCAGCNRTIEVDMEDNYPYSLQKGGRCSVTLYCEDCERSWKADLRLSIKLELIKK